MKEQSLLNKINFIKEVNKMSVEKEKNVQV